MNFPKEMQRATGKENPVRFDGTDASTDTISHHTPHWALTNYVPIKLTSTILDVRLKLIIFVVKVRGYCPLTSRRVVVPTLDNECIRSYVCMYVRTYARIVCKLCVCTRGILCIVCASLQTTHFHCNSFIIVISTGSARLYFCGWLTLNFE